MGKAFVGIDVGTGSARAGIFDAAGVLLASAKAPVEIWREAGEIVEQSGDQVWQACDSRARGFLEKAAVAPQDIAGVGFDATCSLVVVAADGSPVAVGPSGDPKRNIIVWMDHRANGEAAEINGGGHAVLRNRPPVRSESWWPRKFRTSRRDVGYRFYTSNRPWRTS